MKPLIEIQNLTKTFKVADGQKHNLILDNINLSIDKGNFVTFFGPNGCGKSTLMNIVAGLESYDSGEININANNTVNISLVFQDFRQSLLPWLNVEDNIIFPLRLQGISKTEGLKRLTKMVESLDFTIDYKSRAYTLSGGQAQLTAILRALITNPEILILDEPFSALDYQTTIFLQQKMLKIGETHANLTILFVSHDLDEALFLGDKAVFLSRPPTKIVNNSPIEIPFERPREFNLLTKPEFGELKALAFKRFEEGLKRG